MKYFRSLNPYLTTIIFTILIGLLVFRSYNNARSLVLETVKERFRIYETSLVKASAVSFERFFKERKSNILMMAGSYAVQRGDEKETRRRMRDLVAQLKDEPITGIAWVNRDGYIRYAENKEGSRISEGTYVADRSYFNWAKNEAKPGEVYLSEPLIARTGVKRGEWVATLTTPLYYQNRFNGLFLISFTLEGISNEYVLPTIFSEEIHDKDFYVTTRQGNILFTNRKEFYGVNMSDYYKNKDWPGKANFESIVARMKNGEEGCYSYTVPSVSGGPDKKRLIAYAPIEIDGFRWSFSITTPYSNIEESVLPIFRNQINILSFSFLIIAAFSMINFIGMGSAKNSGFKEGYQSAKKEKDA